MSSLCSQSVSAGDIAVTMAWVSELMALGRLRVIRPTPWSTRVRISSMSVVKWGSFAAAVEITMTS